MRFCAIPAWPVIRGAALAVLVSMVVEGWLMPGVVALPALAEGGFTIAPPAPGVVAVAPSAPIVCVGTDGVVAGGAVTDGVVAARPVVPGALCVLAQPR